MSEYNNVHNSMAEDDDIAKLKAQIALMQQGVNEDEPAINTSSFHTAYPPTDFGTESSAPPPSMGNPSVVVTAEKEEADRRSVHVAQVDYSTTADQLQAHFTPCGDINRVNIMVDKYTHQPKGFAYLEFATLMGAQSALTLNDTALNGRQIKVTPKRTNIPGLSASRGRGGRGRGRGGHRGGGFMTPYGAPYYPYPYSPSAYPSPYTPYPYPPPPPIHGAPFYGPGVPGAQVYHQGGAYRRGGRGNHRYTPYGGVDRRGGRGRGRGQHNYQGDREEMFIPNDNAQLPRHGIDDNHESSMDYGSGNVGSYPVEEPASGHY